jgi:hypothetical protein
VERAGRPGDKGFSVTLDQTAATISCACGSEFDFTSSYFDQAVLASNFFVRAQAMSNHFEYGMFRNVQPGLAYQIKFTKPFEIPAFVQFGAGGGFIWAKEHCLTKDSMWVLTSVDPAWEQPVNERFLSWSVYGLVNVAQLPLWRLLFYGAMTHSHNGLLKPALLDYASAFGVP